METQGKRIIFTNLITQKVIVYIYLQFSKNVCNVLLIDKLKTDLMHEETKIIHKLKKNLKVCWSRRFPKPSHHQFL